MGCRASDKSSLDTGYLEGQGDLVSRLLIWTIRVTVPVVYLLSPSETPSRVHGLGVRTFGVKGVGLKSPLSR